VNLDIVVIPFFDLVMGCSIAVILLRDFATELARMYRDILGLAMLIGRILPRLAIAGILAVKG
jgi:hypothetical protein